MARAIDWPSDEELKRMYEEEGLSHREISNRLDCSRAAVQKHFKRNSIADSGYRFVDWPDRETLEEWYLVEGKSQGEIADTLNTDSGHVYRHFQKIGIGTKEHPDSVDWPSDEELKRMYEEEGLSTNEIAEDVGCAPSMAWRKLKEAGVAFRDKVEMGGCPEQIDWPEDLDERYGRGETLTALSNDIGCTITAVRYKLERMGVDVRSKRGRGGPELDKRDRRFLRYTRWAVGETQPEFAERLTIAHSTYQRWEGGQTNPSELHAEDFELIRSLGRRHAINPRYPRRQLYWKDFLRVITDLRIELDVTLTELSRMMGFTGDVVPGWVRGAHRPNVGSHKQVREFAEIHGVWQPPEPVWQPPESDWTPEPEREVELSEADRNQILVLRDSGTNPADLAMMFDVSLSKISEVLKNG